jgi:hypothetical protein
VTTATLPDSFCSNWLTGLPRRKSWRQQVMLG